MGIVKSKKLIREFVHFVPNFIYESLITSKADIPLEPVIFTDRDHFPHQNSNIEWWYFTGIMDSPSRKNKVGFEVTFFRFRTILEGRIIHTAFTDVENGTFHNRGLVLPLIPGKLFKKDEKEIISVSRNSAEFHNKLNSFKIKTSFKDLMIDLNLSIKNVMHGGNNGVLNMMNYPNDSSYYFSFPDLAAEGKIRLREEEINVSGTAWHDHQWGNFHIKHLGWNWFSLRFDSDNLYIMIFDFIRHGTAHTIGNLFKDSKNIKLENIKVESRETIRTRDGIEYPVEWKITILNREGNNLLMKFSIKPLIKEQHISSYITHSYWEGISSVKGEVIEDFTDKGEILLKKRSLKGLAYVELTGYE